MSPKNAVIQFFDNGELKELKSSIQSLKVEKSEEILYTSCGNKISINQIFSFNGMCW
jgi:hypothetical protein